MTCLGRAVLEFLSCGAEVDQGEQHEDSGSDNCDNRIRLRDGVLNNMGCGCRVLGQNIECPRIYVRVFKFCAVTRRFVSNNAAVGCRARGQDVVSVRIYGGVEHFRNPDIVGQAALPSLVVVGRQNEKIVARTTAIYYSIAVFGRVSALVLPAIPALNLFRILSTDQFE